MRISELLKKDTLSLSFEVFPPKTESGFESVKHATEEIAKLSPSFMSVTYGAGGGTSKYTLDIAKNIKERYGVPTLAHLTCVSSTRATVHDKIEAIRAAGITNVMALRGDIPKELEGADRSGWDYRHVQYHQLYLEFLKLHFVLCHKFLLIYLQVVLLFLLQIEEQEEHLLNRLQRRLLQSRL